MQPMPRLKALIAFFILICLSSFTEARKVRIAVATLSQSVLPLVVAQEKDYFKEENLDVELILTTASVANMALLGGNVDLISSGTTAIGAISRRAPLKFVFVSFSRPMHWLYARPEIDDLKKLKGKKIGVSAVGASLYFLILEMLKRHGLDGANEVTLVGSGTTANRYAALQSGIIDATNLTPPYNFRAQESGLRELVAFVKEDYLLDLAGTIVMREDLNPILLEKCLRSMFKGLLHIRQRRASTVPILAKLMKIEENLADKVYTMVLPGLTADGSLDAEIQKKVLDFVVKIQGIKEPVSAERVFDFLPLRKICNDLAMNKWRPTL